MAPSLLPLMLKLHKFPNNTPWAGVSEKISTIIEKDSCTQMVKDFIVLILLVSLLSGILNIITEQTCGCFHSIWPRDEYNALYWLGHIVVILAWVNIMNACVLLSLLIIILIFTPAQGLLAIYGSLLYI